MAPRARAAVALACLIGMLAGAPRCAAQDEAPLADTRSTRAGVKVDVSLTAEQCLDATNKWAAENAYNYKKDGRDPKDLLFFLHVPRTAGRTTHGCLLRKAYPPSRRCSKSYDKLRFNDTERQCGLLSSHDDFSVVADLPPSAAVMTMLRDPVDRLISTYEFAVEVAARPLPRGDKRTTSSLAEKKLPKRLPANQVQHKTNTRDVWPWIHLVPFMEDNIWSQVRQDFNQPLPNLPPKLNPYSNQLVMPLETYAKHPIVNEIVNNGHTFQLLGLTNYSVDPDAPQIRWCSKYPDVQDVLVGAATKRLEQLAFVGLTNLLDESYALMSATFGWKMHETPAYSQGTSTREIDAFNYGDEDDIPDPAAGKQAATPAVPEVKTLEAIKQELKTELQQAKAGLRTAQYKMYKTPEEKTQTLNLLKADVESKEARLSKLNDPTSEEVAAIEEAVRLANAERPDSDFLHTTKLGVTTRGCMTKQSNRMRDKRKRALGALYDRGGRTVDFSYTARRDIDPAVIDLIMRVNSMDMRLHTFAMDLFRDRQVEYTKRGTLEVLPPPRRLDLVNQERDEHHRAMMGGPFAGRSLDEDGGDGDGGGGGGGGGGAGGGGAGGRGGGGGGPKGFDRNIPPQGPKGAPGRGSKSADIFEDAADLAEEAEGAAHGAGGEGEAEATKDEL